MRPFRFRAQAAIDQRTRERDEARRRLAHAVVDLHAAEDVLRGATEALSSAGAQYLQAMAQTTNAGQWSWHRPWMSRLEQERTRCLAETAARADAVQRSRVECSEAERRLETLVRLREHAWRDWRHAADAEERKDIDAVATLRHVAARRRVEGSMR